MNTNNERIDVLAVIDELIDVPVIECQDDQLFVDRAKEARAAVAELIEAAREYRESSINFHGQLMTPSAGSLGRLNTALARVGAP